MSMTRFSSVRNQVEIHENSSPENTASHASPIRPTASSHQSAIMSQQTVPL